MTESFSEMFEQSLANQRIRPGMILMGLVVDVGPDVVIINVGLKSEAVIPLDQFKNERGEIEVKAGDQIEVALDARKGQACPHLDPPRAGLQRRRDRDRHHLRPRQGWLYGRYRDGARLSSRLAGRRASGS